MTAINGDSGDQVVTAGLRTLSLVMVLSGVVACQSDDSTDSSAPDAESGSPVASAVESSPVMSTAGVDFVASELRKAGAAHDAALGALDAEKRVAAYAADAVLMREGEPSAKGSDAIRSSVQANVDFMRKGDFKVHSGESVEAGVSGDLGFRSGKYTITSSGQVTDAGKWLEVWKKSDGRWQIVQEIWNSDMLPLLVEPDEEGAML